LIELDRSIPLVVVPDIHARVDLLTSVLSTSFPEHGIDRPLLSAIDEGSAQFLMIGDYVHGEARVRDRWVRSFEEFTTGYRKRDAMDEEMRESLSVLQIAALLKRTYPRLVHGLKGNHENIANEEGGGNHQFGKFVYEGAMVAEYMNRVYPGDAFAAVYRFEKSLPLLAVYGTTLVSHAEPARAFDRDEIISYRDRGDVVEGMTWTDNGAAERGSVDEMIATFIGASDTDESIYLGGHRPVHGAYALRAGGRYVQFHNPSRYLAAIPPLSRPFDPDRDIVELDRGETLFDG
jgi:hypothetical protein